MHVVGFLSNWLAERSGVGHQARLGAVTKAVRAVIRGGKLSLTSLGRYRPGNAQAKNHIKAMDRLLGNAHLHAERVEIYRALARMLVAHVKQRLLLVVDWSDFEPGQQWATLKAAVPIGGRAISVYEEVFPFHRYNTPRAHREFLRTLKSVLPKGCCPIIVTDAGFRGPWFKEVESYGWDWMGRVRNTVKYFSRKTGRWCYTRSLDKTATWKPVHLGEVLLSRQRPYRARLYLVRAYDPRARRRRPRGPSTSQAKVHRKLHRAPWLLATSLRHEPGAARKIKQLYAKRMQIEETFRDTKSHRWGLGLRYARSKDARRLEVLLLIGTLATLGFWLAGLSARILGYVRHFQANTERRRPVLSTVFLGFQLLCRPDLRIPNDTLRSALHSLRALVSQALPSTNFVGIPQRVT